LLFLSFPLSSTPLRSPPFPYTTLFRSSMNEQRIAVRIRETYPKFQFVSKGLIGSGHYGSRRLTGADTTASQRSQARRPLTLRVQDRKSTRLNSSHVSISYSVFCLKKKN